ncbi:MAG: hypothetical protein H7Y17_14195 [Chlorobia bacterium]|nr:hypothetical protein [Fimbriimonadaceae bacterium]
MVTPTIIISYIVFAFGSYVVACNWVCVVRKLRGLRSESWVPVLGGVIMALPIPFGLTFIPWYLCWVPLLIDPGCTYFVVTLLIDRKRHPERHRLGEVESDKPAVESLPPQPFDESI